MKVRDEIKFCRLRAGMLAFCITASAIGGANASVLRPDGKELLNLLRRDHFTIVWRVSEISSQELVRAKALPPQRALQSIMVDAGGHYQDEHAGIDFVKPTTQLVFGAISPRYILICYLTGGLTRTEHLILIQRDSKYPRVVAKGLVSPLASNFNELKARLKFGRYLPVDIRSTYVVPLLGLP